VSSQFSGDLRDASADRWLARPVYESDDAPSTQTTTALDPEILIGDMSQYVIVDRLGMTVELVAHLMGSNQRPIGARGLYCRWRTGGDATNVDAWRLLVDRTSA
jgi:HK97 family phage major capsid protein